LEGEEMTSKQSTVDQMPGVDGIKKSPWNWQPTLPIEEVPVFVWPPRPVTAFKFLLSWAYIGSILLPYVALASLTWFYLQPALERCRTLQIDWIAQMFARNLVMLAVIATALHLYLHTCKRQSDDRKFDSREFATDNPKFLGRNQVLDNIIWTCLSGVTVWTAYEVFYMWAYANDMLPFFLDWREHPLAFVAMFFAIPFWSALHFYFVHRLLHWRPLYRMVHSVHHRNVNLGPWAGLSMHPIEHLLYISSVLIHVVVLSHPLHVFFHCQWQAIGASVSHAGFESLTFKGKPFAYLTSYYHQMHHRYYDCNYGNQLMPWDKLFGTYHDGTPESWEAIKTRRRDKLKASSNVA
jgi:lathosterol oxidase